MKPTLVLIAVLATCAAGLVPAIAQAHPLGNFTINHYSRIEPSGDGVQIYYVLDMAEIPTLQDKPNYEPNSQLYVAKKADELRQNLHLRLNGTPAELQVLTRSLTFPEGQGGLPLLRMEVVYATNLPTHPNTSIVLDYQDDNDLERIGWREIIARPGAPETQLQSASVPDADQSDALRNYPVDLLTSPLAVREAHLSFVPGGAVQATPASNPAVTAINHTQAAFAGLATTGDVSAEVVLVSVLIAMAFGAQHALQPGHGKTIVAAYLVGSRGTPKHALFLGGTVTATHTAGVYLLGFVTLFLSTYIVPEKLYPVIGIASGLLVVGMGGWLLVQRLGEVIRYQRNRGAPVHVHAHGGGLPHSHSHSHSHGGSVHSHLPLGAKDESMTWRSLLALGITGGALPCPEALVVLLATMALGRVGFGLLLIVAFSMGLAGVLVGFGLLMVYARGWFRRVDLGTGLAPRLLSLVSATVIVVAGAVIALQAVSQTF